MPAPNGDAAGSPPAGEGDLTDTAERAERAERARPATVVDLDTRSALVAIVTVIALLGAASIATQSTMVTLVVVSALFAFALDPVVDLIQQRLGLRRGYAVALLVCVAIVVIGGAVAWFGPQTVEQAQSFQDDLPRVLGDLTELPIVGSTLAENDVPQKIQDWAAGLPKQMAGSTSQITNAAETVTTAIVSALGMALIMVALLIDGPWLVSGMRRLLPPNRRLTADRLGRALGQVIGRYFAGSLLLAALQAAQVLVTGLVLGVPLSPLLAVWAGVWNLVPQIGGAIGGLVFVAVAFTQGPTAGVIAAIVFMVYLTFANNVLLPVILGRAVDISPLTTMVATIAGFSIGGVIGAMLAVPLLGAGKAMYFELRPSARPPAQEPDAPRKPGVIKRVVRRVRPPRDISMAELT